MAFSKPRYTIAAFLLTSFLVSPPPLRAEVAGDPAPSQLILDACNETALLAELQELCIETLSSDRLTASAATPAALARETILLAAKKAKKVAELIGSPKEPGLKFCAESYADLIESLRKAERWVEEDKDEVDVMLGAARDSTDYCNNLMTDKESAVFIANQEAFTLVIFAMSAADLL